MQATFNTMIVNEKIIRIYPFCPFSTWNTRHMNFKRSNVTKQSHSMTIQFNFKFTRNIAAFLAIMYPAIMVLAIMVLAIITKRVIIKNQTRTGTKLRI